MEKQKRWQFLLILAVILLTLYNILPTLFYYSKPLSEPIDADRAKKIAIEITERVNRLESEAIDWLTSFNKQIGAKAKSIRLREEDPRLIDVEFSHEKDAATFRKFLPYAGEKIPFFPAELNLYSSEAEVPNRVTVIRQVGVLPESIESVYSYVPKYTPEHELSAPYLAQVRDRVETLALSLGGKSPVAQQIEFLQEGTMLEGTMREGTLLAIAEEVASLDRTTQKMPALAKRAWNTLLQGAPSGSLDTFLAKAETLKNREGTPKQTVELLEKAIGALKRHEEAVKSAKAPLDFERVQAELKKGKIEDGLQLFSLEGTNPFVEALAIDYADDRVAFVFYEDINQLRQQELKSEEAAYLKEKLSQMLYNEIARVGRVSDEEILPSEEGFSLSLSPLADPSGFLALNLDAVAEKESKSLKSQLTSSFHPQHPDLLSEAYPIRLWSDFEKESASEKKLGLVIFAPSTVPVGKEVPKGFRSQSIYVIARGLSLIQDKAKTSGSKPLQEALERDLQSLKTILKQNGFISYSGDDYSMDKAFAKDMIFELDDYYHSLVQATREDFQVKGTKREALLPLSNVEQRILARNKIEDRIQEDLLKWRDEYNAAAVSLDPMAHYLIPAPTQNPYWTNFKINFFKYFRGDDRKILKWGLDLSGGKVVRIDLKDKNGQQVTNPDDIKQTVNELYSRINKMGVSERTIRIENSQIVLEFPGSQAMSAADLIQASQMTFHIVNEKFSSRSSPFKEAANTFLQQVWNEAVVTNRKSEEELNEIAWKHLGGTTFGNVETRPVSEAARTLIDNGLVLGNPRERQASQAFNDEISSIALIRGSDYSDWDQNSHPLLFVFRNYALEGSSLTNIQVGFDPSKGNMLSFNVKGSYEGKNAPLGSPRDDFYGWTSQFSEEKIAGTAKETYSGGHGWRMAVILNGQIITMPTLQQAIRDNASISGHFSQREINQLAADLKGGSLSFTPRILSEQNISAELGSEERAKGITACLVSLGLIALAMIGYYRFAGLVATVAVLFNIFILWGVLQNLDAALTLPGIAGIVLTIAMAVDANVLVFERVREEFAISGRIASAISAGYKKAFSAIFDSNLTTLIVAIILIQFDSGPIKAFAVTLMIGLFSSMFTALFMTRYFFAGWVQNPKNKELGMAQWIHGTTIDFLGKAKLAIVLSLIVMVLGAAVFYKERKTLFGMDFTGGYALVVELEPKPEVDNYRLLAIKALEDQGAKPTDVEVRQLTLPNQLRIALSQKMDEEGRPFAALPDRLAEGEFAYEYQKNPRIDWVVRSLESHGLALSEFTLQNLENNWSNVSGQLSDAMRNSAIMGLLLALVSILIYITFRFEFKFAIAAVIALLHDVIITVGILAFFNWMGFPVQIDLQVIGALMTIIGYSLNDTIIVFDRIREDVKVLKKLSYHEAVNHALNVTLSRTLMTSGTTLLVLFALVLLGGASIFAFSLVMTIGVLIGTLSSLFIASPVMLYLHDREEAELKLKRT
jgi:SecD/SecF fusion protein